MFSRINKKRYFCAVLGFCFMSLNAHASNVGGVFGPVVNEGDQTFQYRAAYDVDSNQLVQRLHYQQSLNDDVRVRGVIQGRKTDQSDFDYDFFQAEVLWQLDDNSKVWNTALRFDARISDDGRPGLLATTWTNKIHWSENWKTTALVLGSVDIGDGSRDGLFLQTRADIVRKINSKWSIGAELFSNYGSTSDSLSFNEQGHQLGPLVKGKLGNGWSIFSGVLFGISDASQDENLRFWITKSL